LLIKSKEKYVVFKYTKYKNLRVLGKSNNDKKPNLNSFCPNYYLDWILGTKEFDPNFMT